MKTIFTVLVEELLVGRLPENLIGAEAPSIKGESPSQGGDTSSHMLIWALFRDYLPFWVVTVMGMLTHVHTNKSGRKKDLEAAHIKIR